MSASKGGLTVSSNGGLTVTGQKRDLMIQAAMAYDETQKHIADLENKLNLALAALEAKNSEIDNLNLLLSQERNRNDNHRNERDQAYAERAMCVRCWRKRKPLCTFAESVTATSLLTMGAGRSSSRAADGPAQSRWLTRTQAEQSWSHSHLYCTPNSTAGLPCLSGNAIAISQARQHRPNGSRRRLSTFGP
jgi:hypothetical protein